MNFTQLVVVCALTGASANPLLAARNYRFDKTLPRAVLESYLSRASTETGLLSGAEHLDDNLRRLKSTGVKFAGRSLYLWGGEEKLADPRFLAGAREVAAKVHRMDPEVVLQAAVFEIVSEGVGRVGVPEWVFREFSLAPEKRNFRYEKMLFSDGRYLNHWRAGSSVPDVSQLETRMWFYYLSAVYMETGVEAIHFGQIELVGRNDPEYRHWADVIGRVRRYAASHTRRHYVICDAHVPSGGIVVDGKLLLDFHSFPLRPKEIAGAPGKAELAMGYIDSIYGRSKGGRAPGGWDCEHLPYLVEVDNWGASGKGGQSSQSARPSAWVWGYDEICWFAHQPPEYRNEWLRYAWKWVREHDPNGFLQMPGIRGLAAPVTEETAAGPVQRRRYYANTRSAACPEGYGQEETIKDIWSQDR